MLNQEEKEFERLLASLRPKAPRKEFHDRLNVEMDDGAVSIGWPVRPGAFIAGASILAASFVVVFYLSRSEPASPALPVESLEQAVSGPTAPQLDGYRLVEENSELIELNQGPIFLDEECQSVREVSLRYLDTRILKNPNDDTEIKTQSNREESHIIPASEE